MLKLVKAHCTVEVFNQAGCTYALHADTKENPTTMWITAGIDGFGKKSEILSGAPTWIKLAWENLVKANQA